MISFIYFDVGGVLIKDFTANDKWQELEKEIGIKEVDSQSFVEFWDANEDLICKGQDVEYVFSLAKEKFNLEVPENYSIMDGFVKRLEASKSIWPIAEEFKSKYKVGLLTNMYPGMLKRIFDKGIMPKVDWDVIVDSSVEGVAKPDAAVFKLAEERCGHKGKEILFIDNSKRHVNAANDFGWNTFWYNSGDVENSNKDLLEFINSGGKIKQ